jgi:hypothetical protein
MNIKTPVILMGMAGIMSAQTVLAGEENQLFKGITLSGAIEIEASHETDYDGINTSDIQVSTAELVIDAQVHEWAKAHLLFLFEEGATDPPEFDEAYLTLGNTEISPFYFSIGRMYVFGEYDTMMVSDPLTLEIGETRETAAQVGFMSNGLYGSLSVFNGETQKNADNTIENFAATLGFSNENDAMNYDFGLDYINNLAESGSVMGAVSNTSALVDYVSAMTARGSFSYGPFSVAGQYLTAIDKFDLADFNFNGQEAQPKAWAIEGGYNFEMMGKESTFALGYQGTEEALALGLPKQRYLATLSTEIMTNTSLGLEWAHDIDYDTEEGGTGNDADTVTLQLAIEF